MFVRIIQDRYTLFSESFLCRRKILARCTVVWNFLDKTALRDKLRKNRKKISDMVGEVFSRLCIWSRQCVSRRYKDSYLLQSYLVAQHTICLMLLRSSPDMVHSARLHKTLVSSTLVLGGPQYEKPQSAFGSAVADCGWQGTASSPPSTAISVYCIFRKKSRFSLKYEKRTHATAYL